MSRLFFYLRYATRNIRRGGRWTTLAIFSIAAGVAAVVALRSLGLAIGDSLLDNTRQDLKGDVRLVRRSEDAPNAALLFGSQETAYFSPTELADVRSFVDERGGVLSGYTTGGSIQIAGVDEGVFGLSRFISTYVIDPPTYPPTHVITAIDPPNVPIAELFTDGNDVLISENMALQQDLAVGDSVRVAGTDELFIVQGIVPTEAEAGIRNIFSAFFGFAYFDFEDVQTSIDEGVGVNNIVIAFDEPLTDDNADIVIDDIRIQAGFSRERITGDDSAVDLLERNQVISQLLGDFIVTMGLGALLIGGVGIMNTMLVLVRRRTNEIAAMKTFGLKGRQVASLFMAEGLLLGIMGSIVGTIIGILLGGIVNQFGERFLQQPLPWRIYPEAVAYGLVLGIVISIIFSLVPIFTALRIRPGVILRPNESPTLSLGFLQQLGLLTLITISIGLLVGQIVSPSFGLVSTFSTSAVDPIGQALAPTFGEELAWQMLPYIYGVIGVTFTMILLGVLVWLLWIIVWIVGKLPAFGSVDLRLALRNLSTHRLRTATTLLALSAGMFALSSITFVGEGTRQLLNVQLSSSFGGNVLAFPLTLTGDERLSALTERNLTRALENVPGVEATTIISPIQPELVAIDGTPIDTVVPSFGPFGDDEDEENDIDFDTADDFTLATVTWNSAFVWESDQANVYDLLFDMQAGRNLTPEDNGQRVLLGPAESAALLGIEVGSTVTYRLNDEDYDFEVVGLKFDNPAGFGSNVTIPPNAFDNIQPLFQIYSFQVAPESVSQAVVELSSVQVPRTLAIDAGFVDSLVGRFIDQFTALPTIVGLLSLFAAAVIMANTVALSTLERRRQIGILKSIGLKSNRVLVIMLIESTIVGLLSALLGIGLSYLFLNVGATLTETTIPLPRNAQFAALGLIIAAVVIGWIATFLSANIAVRERVMNVLRYE